MCIGNCGRCKTRCKDFLEKCLERIGEEQKKEDGAMSEAVGGCHAGTDEKIGRLDERVNTCRRIAVVSLSVAVVAVMAAVWLAAKM